MILDRKYFSFLLQVIDRASDYADGRVLNNLELVNKEGTVRHWEQNGSYIPAKGLICDIVFFY